MSTYDLTGADPAFLREDIRFAVFEANQRLFLGEPAFANTIQVVWLDGGANPVLVEGVQWRTTYQDRDYAAMSEAKLVDENFSDILVNSIENLDVPASDRVYAVQYQALKLKPSQEDPGIDGPNPTPGLLSELINNVNYLMNVKNPLSDLTSDALDGIKALQEDVTGVNPANLVTDERHYVNVPDNKMIVKPAGGSFWEHDVVVTNVSTGLPLVEGTDYKFIGWDKAKQAIAEHTSQVYTYIFLLTPIVGNVDVTYRAFGGEATVADISAIKDVLAEITNILVDGDLLSAEALPYTGTVVDIITRLASIEDAVRHYSTATHQYAAETDGKHWYTIAALYRDVWDTQTLETGQVHLSLRNWTQKWNYDVLVTFNLKRAFDKLTVKTIASADKNNVFELGKYDGIDGRKVPEFRVVWKDVGGVLSGAQLQIGMEMTALQPEVLTVYDRSGSGSDLVIKDHIVGQDTVYDDAVVLPDATVWYNPFRGIFADQAALEAAIPVGTANWYAFVESTGTYWRLASEPGTWIDTTDPDPYGIPLTADRIARHLVCPQEGYLAFAGALPLTAVQSLTDEQPECCVKADDFDIKSIRKVRFFVYDRIDDFVRVIDDERMIGREGSYSPSQAHLVRNGSVMFYPDDLCALRYFLSQDTVPGSEVVLTFEAILGSNSIANDRFDLRQIVLFF